ncbi:hypothetical protein ACIPW9_26040 [Streptomyces sp. NPDC090052]|uniref:hypothetical protein n=1 Tax=Streptomyces sp. NPDC090052 TaxID=3365931 RepID=UPI0038232B7B
MRRQHAAIAATATALCLGGLVAACAGGTAHHGYAAVGAAGAGQTLTTPVPPSGKVTLTPLDGPGTAAGHGTGKTPGPGDSGAPEGAQGSSAAGGANSGHHSPNTAGGTGAPGGTGGTGASGTSPTPGGPGGSATPGAPGRTGGGSTSSPPGSGSGSGTSGGSDGGSGSTSPAPTDGPAVLKVGAPDRAATDKRWCEKVTVRFSNTGGSPVASGTVTFSTHIIGGLGVDWATRTSTQPLPGPIAAGADRSKTYTVCVDDWRVPLGMHIETRKVSVSWK